MNVSAVIPTRGNVDLSEILDSLPRDWQKVVWDNSQREDLAVFGRYAAIEECEHDVIYTQDDDCVLNEWSLDHLHARATSPTGLICAGSDVYHVDPACPHLGYVGQANPIPTMIEGHRACAHCAADHEQSVPRAIVTNMPARFRHDFYRDHCLVGFGAMFHRSLPLQAFERYWRLPMYVADSAWGMNPDAYKEMFQRTCDIVFTALTPRILVDLPYRDLPWASDPDRMWRQPDHVGERTRMLELVRKVRDA